MAEYVGIGAEVRRLTDGQGADLIVEVGDAGKIAQSIVAVAYRGILSLVGALTIETSSTGLDVVDLLYSAATLRVIGGGSRSDLEDMNRVSTAHKLRPVVDRVFPFEEALDAACYMGSGAHFGKVVISH